MKIFWPIHHEHILGKLVSRKIELKSFENYNFPKEKYGTNVISLKSLRLKKKK